MRITVVGAGFVGSATGRGLKKHGHNVVFVDVDPNKIADLKKEGFEAFTPSEYQKITTDCTMFCVPTPTKGDKTLYNYIEEAATQFGKLLAGHKKYHVVVVRSTVQPGTTRNRILPIIEKYSKKKVGTGFGLAMQPEYLREVTAKSDFERPWFVLVGEYDKRSGDTVSKIYSTFDAPIERCGLEEAEFQKYVHNVYNAVKIAFFNEMRILAKKEKWNTESIFQAVALSCEGIWNPIYGLKDLGPFDGSCLPKDTRALLEWGESIGHSLGILRAVIVENLKHEELLGKNKDVRVNYLADITI